jgi:hypothetical protein
MEYILEDEFYRHPNAVCERLLREKRDLRKALEDLLTKPACSDCIRFAQVTLKNIKVE